MIEKIKAALDEFRPHLQMDGGDVEFVSFDESDGILKLKLQGACHGCPMAMVTLQQGIAKAVREKVPEVKIVQAV
ncbi:MAG: NifU family protein [Candidatus Buchananbacteria bacterium]